MKVMNAPTVAVIGAGPGGLSTALLLAKAGLEVTVFESAPTPGGRARSPALGQTPVNLGAHAIYRQGPAERLLTSLGVSLDGSSPRPAETLFWHAGSLVAAPVTPGALFRASSIPFRSRWNFVRRMLALGSAAPGQTAAEWLTTLTEPHTRALVTTLARVATYCNALEVLPADFMLRQLSASLSGVRYVEGGWARLIEQLQTQCEAQGVTVRLGQKVVSVEGEGKQVVFADGTRCATEATVVATSLKAAAQLVPSLQTSASSAIPSRVATLDLVLSELPRPSRRLAFSTSEPLYFSVHSAAGKQPVIVHAMYTLAPHEHGAEQRATLDAWVERLQPGWRTHLLGERFLPEMCVIDSLPTTHAAPIANRQGHRLFVSGDWASTGVLLDGVLDSASATAKMVLGELSGQARAA